VRSFCDAVLLMLIDACGLRAYCAGEHHEFHFFSNLLRDPIKAYPPTFSLRSLVVIEEEA
jgi:hypothetical protein